ncbi:MAG TPA: peptidylprolyl isomerase [bacterium]|nr:peptidylprolyl isomerase [bacterium]
MSQVKNGDTVKVHYTGRLSNGEQFDSSRGGEPLAFTVGEQQVIAGFEESVLGMKVGETKTINIPPEKAYGPKSEELIIQVERGDLPEEIEPEIGMQLEARLSNGMTTVVTISGITEEFVTIDANHELAGEELVFDIELMEIGE